MGRPVRKASSGPPPRAGGWESGNPALIGVPPSTVVSYPALVPIGFVGDVCLISPQSIVSIPH